VPKSIKVSDEAYKQLFRIKGRLQSELKRSVSFAEVVDRLIKALRIPETPDEELVTKLRVKTRSKPAQKLLQILREPRTRYEIRKLTSLNSKRVNELLAELVEQGFVYLSSHSPQTYRTTDRGLKVLR